MLDYTPYIEGIKTIAERKGIDFEKPISLCAAYTINGILKDLEDTLYFSKIN
jgi:hypothetical protein